MSKKGCADLDFSEVETAITLREALAEAKRCLNCKNPQCRQSCPVENDIPGFIQALAQGNLGEAGQILAQRSNLPAVCGRVCPHELQCEAACILTSKGKGIHIGYLEQFVADFLAELDIQEKKTPAMLAKSSGRVAVIGSGPAGLTVSGDLAKLGFSVTVYDSQPEPGGVLLYGIPDYRLPKAVVRREVKKIENLGVQFKNKIMIGPDITVDQLFAEGYDAIFIGTGTALPKELNIPGKTLSGVLFATYFLQTVSLAKAGKLESSEIPVRAGMRVVVIGGGNVAIDAARMALKNGASSVTVLVRKKREFLAALPSEIIAAEKEGVRILDERQPLRFEGERLTAAGTAAVERIWVQHLDQEESIEADVVLQAIGQRPAARIASTTHGIQLSPEGFVITKERPYGMTTRPGVFSGGDVVHGSATVVLAMREAKKVAGGIASYIEAKKLLALD